MTNGLLSHPMVTPLPEHSLTLLFRESLAVITGPLPPALSEVLLLWVDFRCPPSRRWGVCALCFRTVRVTLPHNGIN